MSDYDRLLFGGKCPYTDKPCDDWNCENCEVEQQEREYMKEMEGKNDNQRTGS